MVRRRELYEAEEKTLQVMLAEEEEEKEKERREMERKKQGIVIYVSLGKEDCKALVETHKHTNNLNERQSKRTIQLLPLVFCVSSVTHWIQTCEYACAILDMYHNDLMRTRRENALLVLVLHLIGLRWFS